MASVEKRHTDQGVRYDVRYRSPEGKPRRKTFRRKLDADRFRATVEADKLRGQYVDHADRTTLAEYARRYAAARPHRSTTARRVKGQIETHIAGTAIGERRLADVRPSEVQAWATDRAQRLAPTTLRNLVSLLKSIYAAAVLDRLVASSPVVRVALPRSERPRIVPLTVDQVEQLANTVPKRNRAMVITQAGLGLRIGELLGMRVEQVDFLRRTVRIDCQLAPGEKVRSEPKTPRSRRTLPLPQVVADELAAHLAAFPAGDDGSVFTTKTGAPYSHAFYGAQIFKRAVRAAKDVPEETTTHDLRHHYASVLLAAGESVVAVAERLGHDNANLVLSTYGHLMPDSEERTRKAVDAAWARATDVPSGGENAR